MLCKNISIGLKNDFIMLDIKYIREYPEEIKIAMKNRGVDGAIIDKLLAVYEKRRAKIKDVDDLRAKHNILSEAIAQVSGEERTLKIAESRELKVRIDSSEQELTELAGAFTSYMYSMPNIPLPEVPVGKDESENKVIREVGEKPAIDDPRDYMTIATMLDLIDTQRAAKVSGSRFGYLKNEAALLEIALVRFATDLLTGKKELQKFSPHKSLLVTAQMMAVSEEQPSEILPMLPRDWPFIPIIPPVFIKEEMMRAMGYIDSEKDEAERYFFEKDKLYLVGTAEQSLVPMHADEIFDINKLPLRYVGFSTCFRREAGSYGKDTHGILRVHQFDKVEMVSFVLPEDSQREHKFLIAVEELLMQELKIPYRVVALCTGDISQPSAATYDIEAWLPGQNEGKGQYRETHSSSNTTDFQARRLNIKVRNGRKLEFVHILNGTALAIGRTIIAILENYQQEDGSVKIPEALVPHMGGITEIRR